MEKSEIETLDDLAGPYELAEALGVSKQSLFGWLTNYPNFPRPRKRLRMGPLFYRSEVIAWYQQFKSQDRFRLPIAEPRANPYAARSVPAELKKTNIVGSFVPRSATQRTKTSKT